MDIYEKGNMKISRVACMESGVEKLRIAVNVGSETFPNIHTVDLVEDLIDFELFWIGIDMLRQQINRA